VTPRLLLRPCAFSSSWLSQRSSVNRVFPCAHAKHEFAVLKCVASLSQLCVAADTVSAECSECLTSRCASSSQDRDRAGRGGAGPSADHHRAGPDRHCLPRHPTHFEPLCLELNAILRRGEQCPSGLIIGRPISLEQARSGGGQQQPQQPDVSQQDREQLHAAATAREARLEAEARRRACVALRAKLSQDTGTNLTAAACEGLLSLTFEGAGGEEVSLQSNPGQLYTSLGTAIAQEQDPALVVPNQLKVAWWCYREAAEVHKHPEGMGKLAECLNDGRGVTVGRCRLTPG